MPFKRGALIRILPLAVFLFSAIARPAAQGGNAGSVVGTVTDPTGAVIPGATIHLANALSHFDRMVTSDATGGFEIENIPFNNYQLSVTAPGFATQKQSLVRAIVCRQQREGSASGCCRIRL